MITHPIFNYFYPKHFTILHLKASLFDTGHIISPTKLYNPVMILFQILASAAGWWNRNPWHGPLTRYVKLQVAHAPGMSGTFSPAADFKRNRQLAIPTCITARAWRTCRDACRDRLPAVTGKTFPAFPAHAHPQFCVSGKRPMAQMIKCIALKHWLSLLFHVSYRQISVDISVTAAIMTRSYDELLVLL